MRILFIGDSLVKGSIGVNWVKKLSKRNPEWKINNAGVNGETLVRVKQRLDNILKEDPGYDIIFFDAGANDILIPSFARKGFLFKKAYQYLLQKNYNPLNDPGDFEKVLRQSIADIKNKTTATIILATLSCLNEDLEHPLNKKRCVVNNSIRTVAKETGCVLVDAAACIDGYLRLYKTKDYLLEGFFNTSYFDKIRCRIFGATDRLSKKRGLHLTIDGLHLNSRGALLHLKETENQIKSIIAQKQGRLAKQTWE